MLLHSIGVSLFSLNEVDINVKQSSKWNNGLSFFLHFSCKIIFYISTKIIEH